MRQKHVKSPHCLVCHDLRWDCFPSRSGGGYYERVIHADYRDLLTSMERACGSCSLLQSAVSEFSKPLIENDPHLLESLELSSIRITLRDGYSATAEVRQTDSIIVPSMSTTFNGGYPITPQLDMDTCLNFLRKQLTLCDVSHQDCSRSGTQQFPSRLLFIESITPSISIRLVETQEDGDKYIALSHRWGDNTDSITTTTDNYNNRIAGIPWLELPQTYQDAVLISFELGVKHLWIDSLCIIQDDQNDWENEAAKMADVHSHAYLTIAATGSSNSSGGCLFARWHETDLQQRIPHGTADFHSRNLNLPPGNHVRYAANSHRQFEGDITVPLGTASLFTRAWVFQERFLSTRTIHFHGEEMVWECQQDLTCECGYFQWSEAESIAEDDNMFMTKTAFTGFSRGHGEKQEFFDTWLKMVERFTALGIKYESDRLPAMAGLKERIMGRLDSPYLMGLWGDDLVRGLLWRKQHDQKSRRMIPFRGTNVPTWSWASIQLLSEARGVYFNSIWKRNFLSSRKCHAIYDQQPTMNKRAGSIVMERLRIRGPTLFCTMMRQHRQHETEPSYRVCKEGDEEPVWLDVTCGEIKSYYPGGTRVCCVLLGSQDSGNKRVGIALLLKELPSRAFEFERIGISEHRLELGWFDKLGSIIEVEVF